MRCPSVLLLATMLLGCGLEAGAIAPAGDSPIDGSEPDASGDASVRLVADGAAEDATADGSTPIDDAGGDADAGGVDAGTPFCDPSDPALIVCIRFEDELSDESATPHTIRESGMGYAAGRVGRAGNFDDSMQMWIDHDGDLSAPPLTIELFVRAGSLPESGRAGVWDLGGHHSAWLLPAGGFACRSVLASSVIRTDVWTHVACVFDGTNASVYVDGALLATGPSSFGTPTAGTVRIGANDPDGDFFEGQVDELRFFGRVRTTEEIAAAAAR